MILQMARIIKVPYQLGLSLQKWLASQAIDSVFLPFVFGDNVHKTKIKELYEQDQTGRA